MEKINVMVNSCIDNFEKVIDDFGRAESLYSIIGLCVLTICCIAFFVRLRARADEYSKEQLKIFHDCGKYIKDLFIELDDSKELLRYILYGNKWLKRVFVEYNSCFNDSFKEIANEVDSSIVFDVSNKTSYKQIKSIIEEIRNIFSVIRKGEYRSANKRLDPVYKMEINSYSVLEACDVLLNKLVAMERQYAIIIGSAGNGKTNLVCSYTELLLNNKMPCLLIDAAKMNGSLIGLINDALKTPDFLIEHKKLYFTVMDFLLFLYQKKFFIIVDAVNENQNPLFCTNLINDVQYLKKYRNFRILLTCRKEFFDCKFRDVLVKDPNETMIIDITSCYGKMRFDENAKRQLISAYREYFRYSGYIAPSVEAKLFSQLLLMRTFFEVYAGSDVSISHLDKYKIFNEYIRKVEDKVGARINTILDQLANYMLKNNTFVKISKNDLNISNQELLDKVIDNSILISKSIEKDPNSLLEEFDVTIEFVFDELRDYCLARYLIKSCKNCEKIDSNKLLEVLKPLADTGSPVLEGIITYCYVHFNSLRNEELCKLIICLVANYRNIRKNGDWRDFDNSFYELDFMTQVILSCSNDILDCEKEFFLSSFYNMPYNICCLFNYSIERVIENDDSILSFFDSFIKHIDMADRKKVLKTVFSKLRLRCKIDRQIENIDDFIGFIGDYSLESSKIISKYAKELGK